HGREFDNEVQFGEFCNANGITHNFSALYTPQLNGVVERKNMTLQEISRTMLNEQSLPQKFWCNVVDTSTYILNRILIRAILGKTPYELLRGYAQNSKAYIILTKHTRKVEESLNVTFDETPPPSKTSPFVDDDLDEEEAIKLDENGIVSRNKARLFAQGYNQQEGIDYDETYASVARLESIRILLAYACALDFKLFQMDVKSAFLNGFINEKVYVAQPPGFIDFEKRDHVYKLKKALYGLKQSPKACSEMLLKEAFEIGATQPSKASDIPSSSSGSQNGKNGGSKANEKVSSPCDSSNIPTSNPYALLDEDNDLFLFARGHPSSVDVIMQALEEFNNVSGLVLSSLPVSGMTYVPFKMAPDWLTRFSDLSCIQMPKLIDDLDDVLLWRATKGVVSGSLVWILAEACYLQVQEDVHSISSTLRSIGDSMFLGMLTWVACALCAAIGWRDARFGYNIASCQCLCRKQNSLCSFVYANNYYMDRHALWRNLEGHANRMRDKPWVLLGDNVALNLKDHSSGGYEPNIAMRDFKECVIMGNLKFNDDFPGPFAIFQPYRISNNSLRVLRIPMVKMEPISYLKSVQANIASRIKNINGKINMPRRNVTWEHQEKASSIDQPKINNASVADGNKNNENGTKNMGDKANDAFG
ncbi:retrovirus-related pol polyprotein from transposon TNT 1-94, partial [Tanacetum coccineum]